MATIASNVFLGAGAKAGSGVAADDAKSSGSSGDFMQLVQGMIQGNTSGEELPSNLLELLLTGDPSGLDGMLDGAAPGDGDSADGKDDDGSDDAAAAAGLAALLAGLQQVPVSGASDSDSTGASSIGAVGSQKEQTLQALLATTQGALAASFDEATKSAQQRDECESGRRPQLLAQSGKQRDEPCRTLAEHSDGPPGR